MDFTRERITKYQSDNATEPRVESRGTERMILDWRSQIREPDQVGAFCEILQQAQLMELADNLSRDASMLRVPDRQDELNVNMFREEVKRYYLEEFCYVKSNPWDDSEFTLPRYFTYLSLHKEDRRTGNVTKIPLTNSHNDIFQVRIDGRQPNRILVYGEGGSGKSTLCKKLAYDWATEDEKSALKDIPILCVMEFRKIQECENIVDAIHSQLLCRDSDITPGQIRRFIRANPSKITIILDGYDECDPKHEGYIHDLLNCKIMATVRTLVTARPWPSCPLRQKTHMYAQISLDGFDAAGIETYVRRYFSDLATADQCLQQIQSHGALNALASTPIVLSMICFVVKICSEDISQIDTITKLFEHFLRALFVNYLNKQGSEESASYTEASKEEDTLTELREFWKGLGEIAMVAMRQKGKKLYFYEDEFESKDFIRVVGLKVGLLIRHKTKLSRRDALEVRKTFYSFPHLLFQEKCAGDYLSSHNNDFKSVLLQITDIRTAIDMQYALAFACGKEESVENAANVVDQLIHVKRHDHGIWKTSPLQPDIKGIEVSLTKKITEGTVEHNSSLFNVALFINYESQSKHCLLQKLANIFGYKQYQQVIDGMYCSHFLYFLEFALCQRVSLPSCLSLTLSQSSKPIALKEYVLRLYAAFSGVSRVAIKGSPVVFQEVKKLSNVSSMIFSDDGSTPLYLNDEVAGMSIPFHTGFSSLIRNSSRKELFLSDLPKGISLLDLLMSVSTIKPSFTHIIMKNVQVETAPNWQDLGKYIPTLPAIQSVIFDNIINPILVEDVLQLLAQVCPNISSLEFYRSDLNCCHVAEVLTTHRDEDISVPNKILLHGIAEDVSLVDLLLSATNNPGTNSVDLKNCKLSLPDKSEDILSTHEHRNPIEVSLTNVGNVRFIDLLAAVSSLCKNLMLSSEDGILGSKDPQQFPHTRVTLSIGTEKCAQLVRSFNQSALTTLHIKAVLGSLSCRDLLSLVVMLSNLRRIEIEECSLTETTEYPEELKNVCTFETDRKIDVAVRKMLSAVPIRLLLDPTATRVFLSYTLHLQDCAIDTPKQDVHVTLRDGRPNHSCGVIIDRCISTEPSISIEKYLSNRYPTFTRLGGDRSETSLYGTPTFHANKHRRLTSPLSDEFHPESEAESENGFQTPPATASGKEFKDFEEQSFLHFMYRK